MSHASLWSVAETPRFGPLEESLHTDVCVVGAGIAGLTTAYLLSQAGKSVLVLDDGPIGGGMTQMTTGHLTNMLDDRYFALEKLHGQDATRLAAESHTLAIERIEAIVRKEQIFCDFARLDGYLFLAQGDKPETLEKELDAAHRAGLASVAQVPGAPYRTFDTGPCLVFPRQGQFHAMKYLAGLAHAIRRAGGRIHTGSHAEHIEGGDPAKVRAGEHLVTAGAVVVATNVPVVDRLVVHTKQAPYMTYVIAARVPHGSVPGILAWDTGDPYHYLRIQPGGEHDVLIVGGEDHKSGQLHDTDACHARLEAWARERFPGMGSIEYAWSGQVMEPIDGLAFIGRNPMDDDNVYIATGDSGMGLTHGTIAGMLLCDLILGHDNPWAALYDPSRKPLRAAREYARETLNMAGQYAGWLTPGDVKTADDIACGSGAIVRRGLAKHALYRDEQGEVHECSAVCPHLGCLVQWNSAGATWDCPCHGSRFDRYGKVMNGPANGDLTPIERTREKA